MSIGGVCKTYTQGHAVTAVVMLLDSLMPDNIRAMVILTLIKSQYCVKYTKSSQRLCNTREEPALRREESLKFQRDCFFCVQQY